MFNWTIVGDGDEKLKSDLQNKIKNYNLNHNIQLTGAVPPTEIQNLYGEADVFLLPSLYEPFGIVLIEAMAAGLPIITTDAGGIPFVLGTPPSGLICKKGDAQSLRNGILRIIKEKKLRADLAQAGKTRSESFELNKGTQAIFEIYEILIKKNNLPPKSKFLDVLR